MNKAKKAVRRRSYPQRARILELMKKEDAKGLSHSEALELLHLQREGTNWAFNELSRNPPSPEELKSWDTLAEKFKKWLHLK